ncbi:Coatomer subunit delta [Grifola frondosa]|uniref:Coatomer subunit delta n=1 Tax=Grifola frondosa TaxID=5627 RepID=A0A1C7MS22_GRIFR|nr:Coatomer subunit delta [Grifola frondosa]
MVVLAASICTKGGKAVISRQFRDMSRARIESLLASFPKLIPTNTQHTSVETADVRYVYQPLEDLYILLITNKASNILQDIETLHLFARVVSDMCRSAEQREILKNAFELLGAFDEIVSLGYREQVNLMQVRNVLEMESHEEKIQEIIARNKEAEAKEELKRRAKQLEMQRREQQRRAAAGGPSGGSYLGGASPAPSSLRAPAFKGSGMKLGSKKTKQSELLDALGGEALLSEDMSVPTTPSIPNNPEPLAAKSERGSVPAVTAESVHVVIRENINMELVREGGLNNLELKGDMNLHISDPSLARIKLALAPASNNYGPELQFKQHPNVGKFIANRERVVALKDPSRSFPNETYVPLSINCWPTPSNDGTCDVNIEYELENEGVSLHDVVISIPLPDGSYPTVSPSHTGDWALNSSSHSLDWSIPLVNAEERSGSLEFTVGGDDPGAFFPVQVAFVGQGSVAGVRLASVTRVDNGEEVVFSEDATVTVDNYTVV